LFLQCDIISLIVHLH